MTTRKFKRKTKEEIREAEKGYTAPVFADDSEIDDIVNSAKKSIKGLFIPASEEDSLLEVTDWVKMPEPIVDMIGTPGLPCGLITEIYGKKDCGKTTLATEALVSTQRDGGIAILMDTERKFNLKRAAAMGLNIHKGFLCAQVKTIEQVFEKFQEIVNHFQSKNTWSKRKICVVWDALGGTPTDSELDDSTGDYAATAARVIKGGLRKVVHYIHDTKVCFVIINHVYQKTNVRFGKQTTPYGGNGPDYYSVLQLEFARVGRVRPPRTKSPDPFCGIKTQIECVKNHMSQPFRTCTVDIDWKGFILDRPAEYAPEGYFYKKDVKGAGKIKIGD